MSFITINSPEKYAARQIDGMGSGYMNRELLKNILLSNTSLVETYRLAFRDGIDYLGFRKLAYMNSMVSAPTNGDLVTFVNFNKSSNLQEEVGGKHRGEGFKLASLAFNKIGMMITTRSANPDDILNPIYTRVLLRHNPNGYEIVETDGFEYVNPSPEELGEADLFRYDRVPPHLGLWDVKMFGCFEAQDTFSDPYGSGEMSASDETYDRFYEFASNKPLKFVETDFCGDCIPSSNIRSMADVLASSCENDTTVEVDDPLVYRIRYSMVKNKKDLARHKSGVSLIDDGEQVVRLTDTKWHSNCGYYGVLGTDISPKIVISLFMRPESVLQDRNRAKLIDAQKRELSVEQFALLISESAPAWYRNLSAKISTKASTKEKLEKFEQMFIDGIRASKAGSIVEEILQGGGGTSKTKQKNGMGGGSSGSGQGGNHGNGNQHFSKKTNTVELTGKANAKSTVPEPHWPAESELSLLDMVGKTVQYHKHSKKYIMNSAHPTFKKFMMLYFQYDSVRKLGITPEMHVDMEERAREYIEVQMGFCIIRALREPGYSQLDRDAATSQLALHNCFSMICGDHVESFQKANQTYIKQYAVKNKSYLSETSEEIATQASA